MSAPGNAGVPAGRDGENADGDVGAPGDGVANRGERGWYSRGYLPMEKGEFFYMRATHPDQPEQ